MKRLVALGLIGLALLSMLWITVYAHTLQKHYEFYKENQELYAKLLLESHDLARHHRWLALRLLWNYKAYSDIEEPFHPFPVLGNETFKCERVRRDLDQYVLGCYVWANSIDLEPSSREIIVIEGIVYDYPVTKYIYLSDLNAYIYLDNHTSEFILDKLVAFAVAFTKVYVRNNYTILNFREYFTLRTTMFISASENPDLFDELERVYGLKADLVAISNYTESILIVAPPGGSCVGCYERKVIWDIVKKHTGVDVTGYLVYVYIHRHPALHSDPILHNSAVFTVSHDPNDPPIFYFERYINQELARKLFAGFNIYNKVLYIRDGVPAYVNHSHSLSDVLELIKAVRNITKPEVEIVYVVRRLHDIPEGVSFTPVQINFRVPACAKPVKPPENQVYFDYIFDYYMRINKSEPLPQPITENIHCPEGWSLRGYETKPPEFTETTPVTEPVRPPGVSPAEVIQAKDETQNLLKYIVIAVVVAVLGLVSWYVLSKHFLTKETAP